MGTHYHIFGECPLILPFWSSVQSVLQSVLEMDLTKDPVHYLLDLPVPGIPKYANKLLLYILLAAKRVIPTHWLSSNTPTQAQLILAITQIRRMEHMTAVIHDSTP